MSIRCRQAITAHIFLLLCVAGCRPGGSGNKAVLLGALAPATRLTVTSPDLKEGSAIPDAFSDYGAGQVPTLHWSAPPVGTRSLAVLVEDPDAPRAKPFVHWAVFGIMPNANELGAKLPAGAVQAPNSAGNAAYMGPRPPEGDPPHHYHFQVFALDTAPPPPSTTEQSALLATLRGHTLAGGELVATYEKPR